MHIKKGNKDERPELSFNFYLLLLIYHLLLHCYNFLWPKIREKMLELLSLIKSIKLKLPSQTM